MYEILINDKQKNIIKKSLESVVLVLNKKDVQVFDNLANSYKKTLSKNEKEMVIAIREILPEMSNDLVYEISELKLKLESKENLTKRECQILNKSLDAYSRLGIAQIGLFYEYIQNLSGVCWSKVHGSIKTDNLSLSAFLIGKIFEIPRGSFLSIAGAKTHDDYKIAYEMTKVITRYMSYERNPKGGWTVNFDRPLGLTGEEMIKIHNVESGFKIKSESL